MDGSTEATRPSWGSRLIGIEGLRALAAFSVLANHVWLHGSAKGLTDAGFLNRWLYPNLGSGLTLFFTLSGFLLYRPFAKAVLGATPGPSLRAFLRNRALRILPAYWVILLLVALVFGVANLSNDFDDVGYMHDLRLLGQNLLLLHIYTPDAIRTGIGPSWSLAVETIFYVLLPVLAAGAYRLARGGDMRRRTMAAFAPAALLLVVGVVFKLITYATRGDIGDQSFGNNWHSVLARNFVTSADLFAFGMAAAVALTLANTGVVSIDRRRVGAGALVVGLGVMFVEGAHHIPIFYTTAMAAGCGLLVLYVTLPTTTAGPGVHALENRWIVRAGVISYSVYLWHEPVTFWLRDHNILAKGGAALAINILVVTAVTIMLSEITYRLVERPALGRKAAVGPRDDQVPEPTLAAAAP